MDLKDSVAPFLIQCKEKRGFDSEKIRLNIPTAHLEKPDIVIADYKINDGKTGLASGNGNGIPENGETIELTAFVKNKGVGRAIKIDLGIASINSGVEVIRKQTEITQILPGQTMSGKLAFVIPRTYSGGDIRVDLKASDVRGVSDGVKQLALNLNTIRPILAYSYNITDSNGNGFVENGETCELEIRVANKGQMEARAVSINVDSADFSFSRNRTELGRLETSSTNIPTRFSFTVPRTLEKESVDVKIQLTQAEFPGQTENINVPIKVSRPKFAISHQILNPNGNGVIEQGESVDLVVRVKNTGQLDAADVNLSININQKGIILTSAKEFSIGRIQSGRESDPITFIITVQKSVPAGDLPVNFKITQKDFKSRNLVLALNVASEKAKEITVAGQKRESDYRPVTSSGRFKMAPHVVITTPRDGRRVVTNTIDLRGIVADDRGVVSIDINVNGMRIDLHDRGIAVKGDNTQSEFYAVVPLRIGRNEIIVTALDDENLTSKPKSITVFYEKKKGEIWAAVIGINDYRHVKKLDYARNDASAFADYLRTNLDIQADHLFELYDGQATKRNIQSLLGTQIRSKAGHEDTVIIFFAGHGAPEDSETSLDGDGIETSTFCPVMQTQLIFTPLLFLWMKLLEYSGE
ncbi:MAG: caspase family protein [Deltaproteobacteria bacterium]|nr:caspase family protein [Deltaproteobacteria bacterium]